MAANRTESEFTTVASKAPARKESRTGLLVLVVIVGVVLAGAIAYQLSQRKNQAQALAADRRYRQRRRSTGAGRAGSHRPF